MRIRKGLLQDSSTCFHLFKLDNEDYWELRDFETSATHDDVIFLIAEQENKILGYILGFLVPTRRSEAGIHETRVRMDERGKGIGEKLVESFCIEALNRNARTISAEIEQELLPFYVGVCGFREVGKWIEVTRARK
jgi:GNAT superfamily N-acetyltransferase